MPSSKFSRSPVPRRRPPICIAPYGSCRPPYDRRRPLYLNGMVHWFDADIFFPANAAGLLRLGPRTPGGAYVGTTATGSATLGAAIQDYYPAPFVSVAILIWDPWRNPEVFVFPDTPMPLDKPFNTRTLTHVFVPGMDTRTARFAE